MIPIGIERNRILQMELEQQREIESKTLNSLFSTIWIDPDEAKPVEEIKEVPKKKVLGIPKPID